MPMAIPLIISGIGAAAAGAAGSGLLGAITGGGGGGGSADAAKQAQDAQLKQAQADQQAKQKAILASLPNAQEQSGGALSAPSLTDLAAVIAGLPGEATSGAGKGALSQFLGAGTGPTTGASTGSPDTLVGATYGLSGSQG
jgi:hypothetical protein